MIRRRTRIASPDTRLTITTHAAVRPGTTPCSVGETDIEKSNGAPLAVAEFDVSVWVIAFVELTVCVRLVEATIWNVALPRIAAPPIGPGIITNTVTM